jgi:hypothetical protein
VETLGEEKLGLARRLFLAHAVEHAASGLPAKSWST